MSDLPYDQAMMRVDKIVDSMVEKANAGESLRYDSSHIDELLNLLGTTDNDREANDATIMAVDAILAIQDAEADDAVSSIYDAVSYIRDALRENR